MSTTPTKHFRSYRPLRRRIEKHLPALTDVGFRIVEGHDSGWFGDGRYLLSNGRQALRITRSRGEEFLELAFKERPADDQWFDVSELLVAFDAVAFEDVVDKGATRHDLDFKIVAYLELYPKVDNELASDSPALQERLGQVRRRAAEFARQRYGRNARA